MKGVVTVATKVVYDVWAGQSPTSAIGGINTRTEFPAAAKSLFTRYVNRGVAYASVVKREWDPERNPQGCCGAVLTTLHEHGAGQGFQYEHGPVGRVREV